MFGLFAIVFKMMVVPSARQLSAGLGFHYDGGDIGWHTASEQISMSAIRQHD